MVRWLPLRSLLLLLVPRSVLAPVVAADGNCIKLKHACKRMKPCCHGWSRASAGKWMNEAERIPEGDALSFSGRCGSSTRHGDAMDGRVPLTDWLPPAATSVVAALRRMKWCQSDFSFEISYRKSFRCANGMQFEHCK